MNRQELINELKLLDDGDIEPTYNRIADFILSRERSKIERVINLCKEAKTMLIISGYATSKPDRAIDYLNWSAKVEAITDEILKGE